MFSNTHCVRKLSLECSLIPYLCPCCSVFGSAFFKPNKSSMFTQAWWCNIHSRYFPQWMQWKKSNLYIPNEIPSFDFEKQIPITFEQGCRYVYFLGWGMRLLVNPCVFFVFFILFCFYGVFCSMFNANNSQEPAKKQICTHFQLFCSPPPRDSRVSGYTWR